MALSSALAFAGVEIIERLINSVITSHPLVFSYETLLLGTGFAAAFGYLISALFQEIRFYILRSFSFYRVPLLAPALPVASPADAPRAYSTQDFLTSSIQHRGPPALLNSI